MEIFEDRPEIFDQHPVIDLSAEDEIKARRIVNTGKSVLKESAALVFRRSCYDPTVVFVNNRGAFFRETSSGFLDGLKKYCERADRRVLFVIRTENDEETLKSNCTFFLEETECWLVHEDVVRLDWDAVVFKTYRVEDKVVRAMFPRIPSDKLDEALEQIKQKNPRIKLSIRQGAAGLELVMNI